MFGGQHNHGWQLCFPLLLLAGGSDLLYLDLYVLGDDVLIS